MKINDTEIIVVRGSVLDQNVDAIVNAAKTSMRGGGGIDSVVHQNAGPEMTYELAALTPNPVGVGEPVVTHGHNLKQKYIIHVAGPMWHGGCMNERVLLERAYTNSLSKAEELGLESIAFCSISTGIYHFPLEDAAQIAWEVVYDHVVYDPGDETSLKKIVFAMFKEDEYLMFSHVFESNFGEAAD